MVWGYNLHNISWRKRKAAAETQCPFGSSCCCCLITHSELAAHLSKLFLQSFTRAKRSLVWTCADPRCFALSRATVIDYSNEQHRSAPNFWNMITKSNVTCAFPRFACVGARSRAGALKPAPAVAPCSMWAWARPKSLQSGDWTPDHEPLSRDPFLDAVDAPLAITDTAYFSRPPLLAECPVVPLPYSARSLATAGVAANCLRVPVMASSPRQSP
jgi:hypothetical protein